MTLLDRRCPACGDRFQTTNSTKRYCTSECQQRNKAVLRAARVTQTDFRPELQDAHRRNGGNVTALRSRQVLTPQEKWQEAIPGILRRFRKDMNARYTDEETAK